MTPGTLVKFTLGNLAMTGRVTHANGKTAEVRSNGATYEVPIDQLVFIPTCQNPGCNNPVKRTIRKYCSRACGHAARVRRKCPVCGTRTHHNTQCRQCKDTTRSKTTDDLLFNAIVKYQRENVGATPPKGYLVKHAFIGETNIKHALTRLEAAGRVKLLNRYSPARSIVVIGARWIYEEPTP